MKKILLLVMLCSALPVFAEAPIIPEITSLGAMQGHDMQSMEDQYFRMRELNDMKSVQEEKQRFEKSTTSNAQPPIVRQMINNTNSEFVEENGHIRIKYTN